MTSPSPVILFVMISLLKIPPVLLVSCLLTVSLPASAWNKNGHTAIAIIAEANFTPTARAQVDALLKDDLDAYNRPSGRTTLPEIASWADEIRNAAPKGKYVGWHTRSNPICKDKLGVCWANRCVDKNLLRYIRVLKDKHANHRRRNEALKWVVHLVGDIHQPLHSGSNYDGTGNIDALLEGGKHTTLHKLWDADLLNAALKDNPVTAKLDATEKLPPYPIAVRMWMLEARDLSRTEVYAPLPGFQCGKDFSEPYALDKTYQEHSVPVVRKQIERAGLRLAQLLNEILDASETPNPLTR